MTSVVLVIVAGLLGVGVVFALALEPTAQLGALLGLAVGTFFGLVALFLKAAGAPGQQAVGPGETLRATASVKHVLAAQVGALLLRLSAVLVGAFACKRQGLEPIAYVLAFFACYLLQQMVEMWFVLAANRRAGTLEAKS
jgi:hypothetical protein